jgi:hypothetical protein
VHRTLFRNKLTATQAWQSGGAIAKIMLEFRLLEICKNFLFPS